MVSIPPTVDWLPLVQIPQVLHVFLQHVSFFLLDQPVGTRALLVATAVGNENEVIIIVIIYPLTARVVGAPQMISQPVSSIFLFSTAFGI